MKSAGARIPINGTHSKVLRSELGVPIAVSPSVRHHLTSCRRHASGVTRLTVSEPALAGVSRQAGSGR